MFKVRVIVSVMFKVWVTVMVRVTVRALTEHELVLDLVLP